MTNKQKQAVQRQAAKVQRNTGTTIKRSYVVVNGVVTFVN